MIERLLLLMQRYISSVEESHHLPRVHPPHGSCFHGHPVLILASQEFTKNEFTLQVSAHKCLNVLLECLCDKIIKIRFGTFTVFTLIFKIFIYNL